VWVSAWLIFPQLVSTISHAAAKNGFISLLLPERDVERSIREAASTSRVFQMEFRGRMVFSPLNRLRLSWFHVIREFPGRGLTKSGSSDSLATIRSPRARRQTSESLINVATGTSLATALAAIRQSTKVSLRSLIAVQSVHLEPLPHDLDARMEIKPPSRRR